METIEISGIIGMFAMALLTLNMVMGMMLSTAYKKSSYWKKLPEQVKKLSIIDFHNYTAYVSLFLILVHVILIPLDPKSGFSFMDILQPLNAPHQPKVVVLGFISLIAILVVIITTQKPIKKMLGFRFWKTIHLISYCTAILFVIHGLLMDPLLKDRPTDWIDPEKMLAELCGVVLIVATVLRRKAA
jgi:sulfoxide reductase heme-binding subunit YedZ